MLLSLQGTPVIYTRHCAEQLHCSYAFHMHLHPIEALCDACVHHALYKWSWSATSVQSTCMYMYNPQFELDIGVHVCLCASLCSHSIIIIVRQFVFPLVSVLIPCLYLSIHYSSQYRYCHLYNVRLRPLLSWRNAQAPCTRRLLGNAGQRQHTLVTEYMHSCYYCSCIQS